MNDCIACRAAALIIRNGKLLAAKHKDFPVYYTVGGGINRYETSEEAVIREVFEETGFTPEIDRLAFVQERFYKISEQKYHEVVFFYWIKNNDDINVLENSFTDQGIKETLHWLPVDDLEKYDITPKFLKTKLLNNTGSIEHIVSRE